METSGTNGSATRENEEMVSLRSQPSRTGPVEDDVVQAEAQRLRRYLRLYFHPAFNVKGNKCTINVFHCLLFVVQIAKLTLITVQMVEFGQDRGHFSSLVNRGQTTLRHLLLEGWDASWETLPYPPAHGDFAVYDVKDIIHKINFAVERYYNVENDAIGFYTILPGENVDIVMQWFDFVHCENCSANVNRLKISETSFQANKGLSSHRDNTTNSTVYTYDIMKEFAHQNLSDPIKKLLLLTLKFPLHSVRVVELDNEALCLSIVGELSFSDKDNNGQVIVQLNTLSSKVACSKLDIDIKDWSLQRASMDLGRAVIAVCCIGLIITLIVCVFAIFVFVQTKLFMRKYFKTYYQPEDPEETDLPTKEYFRFILFWDLCATMADCLTLYGTVKIVFKDERREINLAELDMFTIWLAVGCFFAWFNVLRFVKFYTKFRLLFNTVYWALADVLAYLVCVAVLFTGFFVVGYVVLGPYNIKFSTPSRSFETLASLVNGDEIYATLGIMETIDGSNIYWFSRAFLWTYISVFTIVILNLLIAIFMSAYEAVKVDHNLTMKTREVLADMHATKETMMIFSNSLDPNETPCDTASHCDPCCLTVKNNGFREKF